MLVMNLYNRATSEPPTAMPLWVPYRILRLLSVSAGLMLLLFAAETLSAVDIKSVYDEFLTLVKGISKSTHFICDEHDVEYRCQTSTPDKTPLRKNATVLARERLKDMSTIYVQGWGEKNDSVIDEKCPNAGMCLVPSTMASHFGRELVV